jgi:hypothetical protein
MSFFSRKKSIEKRTGKDRRKSNASGKSEFERRSHRDRRMSLYDRLPEDQRNTVEMIIRHLEKQAD